MQHVWLVEIKNFFATIHDNLREYVDGEDWLPGKEDIKQARYVMIAFDVVRIHGQSPGKGVKWLHAGYVASQRRICLGQDVW